MASVCTSIFLEGTLEDSCIGFCTSSLQCSCLLGYQGGQNCDENVVLTQPETVVPWAVFNMLLALIPIPFIAITIAYRIRQKEITINLSNIGLSLFVTFFSFTFFHQLFLSSGGNLLAFYIFYLVFGESIRIGAISLVAFFWTSLLSKLQKASSVNVGKRKHFYFLLIIFIQIPIRLLFVLSNTAVLEDLNTLFTTYFLFISIEFVFTSLFVLYSWKVIWLMKSTGQSSKSLWKMAFFATITCIIQITTTIIGFVTYLVLTQEIIASKRYLQSFVITIQILMCWSGVFALRGGSVKKLFSISSWQFTESDTTSTVFSETSVEEEK